jgi:hypothetical protein
MVLGAFPRQMFRCAHRTQYRNGLLFLSSLKLFWVIR